MLVLLVNPNSICLHAGRLDSTRKVLLKAAHSGRRTHTDLKGICLYVQLLTLRYGNSAAYLLLLCTVEILALSNGLQTTHISTRSSFVDIAIASHVYIKALMSTLGANNHMPSVASHFLQQLSQQFSTQTYTVHNYNNIALCALCTRVGFKFYFCNKKIKIQN